MRAFLYHTGSGRMYEVLDISNGVITLRNEMATFTDNYDKELLKQQGYRPTKGETEEEARAAIEAKLAQESEEEAA